MSTKLKIDVVSDVACPWCAVGVSALEQALKNASDAVQAELHFKPFELNPQMGPQGEDVSEYLSAKYGSTPEQQANIRDSIRQRGAEVGFVFKAEGRGRIWNTFDAHRLLLWADSEGTGKQHALKKALLEAYHGRAENPSDPAVLLKAVTQVGLDAQRAKEILDSEEFALQVRESEQFYQQAGIHSVPAVIINDKHLISGGQPAEVFERALRQIAAEAAA
jgi:predicted DsbA family dithiol-disulfide isomerase